MALTFCFNCQFGDVTLVLLQPLDLNLDEETLMRIVPFWRTSLSDPNAPSQQYYFDHFEIHPIKV